jgi:hypothetical protein
MFRITFSISAAWTAVQLVACMIISRYLDMPFLSDELNCIPSPQENLSVPHDMFPLLPKMRPIDHQLCAVIAKVWQKFFQFPVKLPRAHGLYAEEVEHRIGEQSVR